MTLDDDIADSLKELSRLFDKPFKQVVNEVLRRGLSPGMVEETAAEYRVVPNRSGFVPGVDPLKLNQLSDQLEAEEFARPGAE